MGNVCKLCGRIVPEGLMERHHLVPNCYGGKETIDVCVDCGNQIHKLFTTKELKKINTLEKLLAEEKMQNWIKWVRNRGFGICMAHKKRK